MTEPRWTQALSLIGVGLMLVGVFWSLIQDHSPAFLMLGIAVSNVPIAWRAWAKGQRGSFAFWALLCLTATILAIRSFIIWAPPMSG